MSKSNHGNSKRNYLPESEYYDNLLKEQPFYRKGMSKKEAAIELNYLNDNLNDFYNGKYKPLWKQSLYK